MDLDFGPPQRLDSGDPVARIEAAIERRRGEQAKARVDSLDAWRAVGERTKLALVDDVEKAVRSLSGEIDGIECSLELVKDEDGWTHTLATAEAVRRSAPPSAAVVELHPSPKGVLDTLRARLFGPKDVIIGDGDFDRRFLIHSSPEDVAKALLDETARRLIRDWCGNRLEIVKYDRGVVYVQSWGVETDATALGRALAIARHLASWTGGSVTPYR